METTRVATAMGATAGNKDGNSALSCPVSTFEFTYGTRNFPLLAEEWIYGMHNTHIYKHMFVHIHLVSVGLTQAHPDYLW